MRAAVLHEFKKPLAIEDVPRPLPDANELLIQVDACGVCHSDLHLADGDWPQLAAITKRPLVLGHEIAGHVIGKGAGVQNIGIGERVGIPWIHWTCSECEFCLEGNENLCVRQKITGVTVDGGFAEFVKAPASHVVKIPEDITAIDVSDEKLALAKSLGARVGLNATSTKVTKELRAKGGVHLALVTSAAKAAYDLAFSCLRPTGALLVVGLPSESICFPPILMAATEVRIRATAVGTRQELTEVLAMASGGKIVCHATPRPLAQVNDVLDQMRQGQVSGRIVLSFARNSS